MPIDERALRGGNMGGAVRVGETVRKASQPQSATIRRLLAHVRSQGVSWVPEPLGTDEQGRDVWSFIPGEAVHDQPEWLWSVEVLTTVARRLREWHDATATFDRRRDDVWWWPGKLPDEVICHVDFAPYNHVYQARRFVGAIDFDLCYPGPRLWDLAYTAYRYVPLIPHRDDSVDDGVGATRTQLSAEQVSERIRLFLDAYGEGSARLRYSASALLGFVPPRLLAVAQWCARQESPQLRRDGVAYRAHARWLAAGARGRADVVQVPNAR